jgi:hypothetical protein
MAKIILTLLCLFTITFKSGAQVLQDPDAYEKLKRGVVSIYNFEFEDAEEITKYLDKKYGNSSISFLFKGMEIYWREYPLIPGSKTAQQFEGNLHKAVEIAEARLKLNEHDPENLLAGLGSAGLLLLYYADNGLSGKVISMAPKTYQWVMKSFAFTHTYKDFYFITGLYNYYREAYANAHPIYKPAMVFFPHGNKRLGLQQLKIAADSAIFLRAESMSFLAGIYQNFEKQPAEAIIYSRKLKDTFNKNPQFRSEYIRDLLLIKKYGEAESLLNSYPYENMNSFFQAEIDILRGVIQEKRYKNVKSAEQLYWSGINKIEVYGQFGADYDAYGYFGLSRIYSQSGNNRAAKQYRKKAKELATFDHLNFDQ